MNKRVLMGAFGSAALALFAGGAWWFGRNQAKEQVQTAQSRAASIRRPGAALVGGDGAKVSIVEFFDPACGACGAFYPIVKQILASNFGRVNLEMRYAPLHSGADQACMMIEAARRQDKFLIAAEATLTNQASWTGRNGVNLPALLGIFKAAGINTDQLQKDMAAPEVKAVVDLDLADFKALNARGTPTFYVNSRPLTDLGPDQLKILVAEEVKAAYG
jgi:protein-disulfide isomerase